jgi:polyribonucleotide nucleotidyltransferase
MEVDPDKIKFIIGRAGSKIQEIQHDCNVRVTIGKKFCFCKIKFTDQ